MASWEVVFHLHRHSKQTQTGFTKVSPYRLHAEAPLSPFRTQSRCILWHRGPSPWIRWHPWSAKVSCDCMNVRLGIHTRLHIAISFSVMEGVKEKTDLWMPSSRMASVSQRNMPNVLWPVRVHLGKSHTEIYLNKYAASTICTVYIL